MNKNIEIYLHNAFRELEAFAIPDVGTFRKVYRAAEYEVHAGTVKPPVVDIEFSQEVSNRLLLTHYLINNVHLSQREADRIVKHISLTVSASINETGKYEINQVGSLLKDPEGQIYFRSVDRRNNLFSADFYGLQPLYLESTPNEQPQEEDPHANTMNDQPIQEPRPSGQRLNFLSLTLIASFCVLVALVYVSDPVPTLVSGDNFSQSPEELIAQSSPAVISDEKTSQEDLSTEFRGITEPAGSDAQQLENVGLATPPAAQEEVQTPVKKPAPVNREMLAENTTPSTTFEEERIPVTENQGTYRGGVEERNVMRSIDESSLSNTTTSLSDLDSLSLGESRGGDNMVQKSIPVIKYYHLIAGSFGTQGAAIDFAKSLEKEGYSPIVLYPKVNNSANYRVSIYRSASIDQVKTYNSKLKKLGKQTGWIYEQLEER